MGLDAGKLDRRITLQSPPTDRLESGELNPDGTWTDEAIVWAEYQPASGKEVYIGEQRGVVVSDVFIIRYRSDIDETWRILFEEKYYEIRHLMEITRREGLKILAEYKEVSQP